MAPTKLADVELSHWMAVLVLAGWLTNASADGAVPTATDWEPGEIVVIPIGPFTSICTVSDVE